LEQRRQDRLSNKSEETAPAPTLHVFGASNVLALLMNIEASGEFIANQRTSTWLGRALTRVFKLQCEVPPDFGESLMQLPGQPHPPEGEHLRWPSREHHIA
jgi:hypothetical protein